MAGLVPAIHVLTLAKQDVDARAKRGHDEGVADAPEARAFSDWVES
jgi:hypothetical protein